MPIADIEKRRLAQHYLLYKSICRYCGASNPLGPRNAENAMEMTSGPRDEERSRFFDVIRSPDTLQRRAAMSLF